jgi:phosphoglycerol transferase
MSRSAVWLRKRAGALAGAFAAVSLSALLAALVLHLGEARLSLPWSYAGEGDTKFYLLLIKGIVTHGSYQTNPSLGAPFGLQLYDFPQGADNLNLLLIRALGLLSKNPAFVLNVFFLLTFPLTAASAYAVLRLLRVSIGTALVCAVIFALLPYHFNRGESQVLLSAYYSVPLGALLFLRLWDERGLFARRDDPVKDPTRDPTGGPVANPAGDSTRGSSRRAGAWASPTTLLSVACCIVVGSAGLYYGVFALMLLLGGSLVALLAGRGRRVALSGLIASALIAATLAANLAPSLAYRAEHGTNTAIKRTTIEADQFGLRLTNLLLPVQQHRLPLLSNVNQRYTEATSTGYCEACFENLGAVGSIGFLWLALVALASIVGAAGALAVRADRVVRAAYRPAALGVALCFVIATIGGLSGLIAFFLTHDIRGWNRISLFIAFFSLLAVALLLDAGLRRLAGRRVARLATGVVLAGVLAFGALDETSGYFVPRYAKNARQWSSDATFVREIESRMPSEAAIFQLPYVPFPEGYGASGTSVSPPNPNFGTTYELARGPIHSKRLRWSYAAIKGRPADWQAELALKPLYLSLAAAVDDGFQGLWVDPHGYSAAARARLAPVLSRLLGVAPLYSPAGDLLFFDLRRFATRLARGHTATQLQELRAKTLYPLRTACGAGGLELTNPSSTPRTATLQMGLSMSAGRPTALLIHYPGGENEQRTLTATLVEVRRRLTLAPGASMVGFSLAGTPAPLAARVVGPAIDEPTLTEEALVPFETPPRGLPGAHIQAGFAPPQCEQTVEAVRWAK